MLEALTFAFFIEIGWIPNERAIMPESRYSIEDVFYIDTEAYLQYSVIWICIGMKVYSWPRSWDTITPNFSPARIDFRSSLGLAYSLFTIGLRYFCAHSVDPYQRITDGIDGYYNEIFFRIAYKYLPE